MNWLLFLGKLKLVEILLVLSAPGRRLGWRKGEDLAQAKEKKTLEEKGK